VVAAVDQCSYCQAAHTAGGKAAGLTEAETIDARRGSSSDAELQALLTVVGEQMTHLGNVSDASWQAGLAAGWTDAQLAESIVHMRLNVLMNSFNRSVQTDLDLPPAPALQPDRAGAVLLSGSSPTSSAGGPGRRWRSEYRRGRRTCSGQVGSSSTPSPSAMRLTSLK
jgi:AhpD family alkylhydroperoxidase